MSLRKKIANSPRVNNAVEAALTAYVRFAYKTSRWERQGFEEMDDCVRRGEAVIFLVWHQRLIMAPYMFDTSLGRICALVSAGRAGQLAGHILKRLGFEKITMNSHKRMLAPTREMMKRSKEGCSIGVAADGPRGPARQCSEVPLIWARGTKCRVFTVAFSQRRVWHLPTWDKQMIPVPFSRGVFLCQEWTDTVPHKTDDTQKAEIRLSLSTALDDVTAKADAAAGRPLG